MVGGAGAGGVGRGVCSFFHLELHFRLIPLPLRYTRRHQKEVANPPPFFFFWIKITITYIRGKIFSCCHHVIDKITCPQSYRHAHTRDMESYSCHEIPPVLCFSLLRGWTRLGFFSLYLLLPPPLLQLFMSNRLFSFLVNCK